MPSTAQIEANQANAQLSTGPRTPEGKIRSARNSLAYGLYASQAILITPEDHDDFGALGTTMQYELSPNTPVERAIFAQILLAAWNIERANKIEADLAAQEGIDPLLSENKIYDRIAHARSRAERSFHKGLKELRAAKAARPEPPPIRKNEPKYLPTSNGPYVRPEPKIGRNEPCPCQSGRKFKQCCLGMENEPKPTDHPTHATNSF